jgi:uncharacterized RDD family membrane protein YckC
LIFFAVRPYNAVMSQREPSKTQGQPDGVGAGVAPSAAPKVGIDVAAGPSSAVGPAREADRNARTRAASSAGRSSRPAPTFYAAGFWRRLGGALVDSAIILTVGLILSWLAGQIAGVHLPESRHYGVDFWLDLLLSSDPALLGMLGLVVATAAIYAAIFQIAWAATPGMRMLGLNIIDLYGDPPSVLRSIARTAGYLASAVTLGLGFLWIGFDRERRGLHDWLSGTHVVKA